ncbi:hypothetical protein E2562_018593 [Oryza meyeriana var. granulata]|uniref:Uncharacterized protein n=1 Tax=Oryza meyeriana var. granulata TaxID=110450 RepID=A0A6G1F9K4_9ORYZ|nr:hypothetical protein E2562_018593 [Oryza meyeriana var. granulata]
MAALLPIFTAPASDKINRSLASPASPFSSIPMEEEEDFLKVLRALRDAARRVECGRDDGPALHALLALEASADDLLAGDPDLGTLRRLLARIGALAWSIRFAGEGGGVVGYLRARCRRCKARRRIKRAAGGVAGEIQAWIDRENVARLVAALRSDGAADASARARLKELEARLLSVGRFDSRLQRALLQHGVFAAVEARLGDPAVGDGCAAAVLALVRFNKDVFVGPVLMGRAIGALVASASTSPAPLRALNGLVAAIRSPLVDELHARGELPLLVALLCSADPRIRALALEFALRIGYYGRKEIVDALLAEGLVKRLLCLQRSDLGGSFPETYDPHSSPQEKSDGGIIKGVTFFAGILGWRREEEDDGSDAAVSSPRPFVSAVARFAVQVEVGEGLSQREKRAAKLEILRRVREAAVSPAEEATVLAEVLWGATP